MIFPAFLALMFLASCAKQDSAPAVADLPHATVVMRDGSRLNGTVAASSPSEITLNQDGGVARTTISMKDVRRVDYGEAPAPAPAPVQAGTPVPAGAPPRAALPEPTHEYHQHAERAAIRTRTFVLPVGTEVPVRTEETIDSARAVEGQTFAAEVAADLRDADGAVVIPRGANATIIIKSAAGGGKFHGAADLVLDLQSVSVEGQRYAIDTADIREKGRSGVGLNKRTGEFAGGGAAVGAIIGVLGGGGKGAGIGAGAGAGAGALTEILTKGGSIKVPAETVITFRLDGPLRVREVR